MIKIKKIVSIFILIIMLALSGCGGEESFTVYFVDDVNNLDPQFANGSSEKNVLYNLFDGLFYLNEWGEAVPDAVLSYDISGNKYTFTLRDDIFWQDETPVTAHDFEFGIKRLFDGSDGAVLFSGILGATEYLNGEGSKSEIAVLAVDSKTLVIELAQPDPMFLELLADPYAYPCNEEFFISTGGRYGLYADAIITNGDYTLLNFNSSRISLSAQGDAPDITVYLNRLDGVEAVGDGDCDIAYIEGDDEIETRHNLQTVESGVEMLVFNTNNEEFAVKEVREAFIRTIDLDSVLALDTDESQGVFSIIPNSVTVSGEFYKTEEYLEEPEQIGAVGGDILIAALQNNFSRNNLSAFDVYVGFEEAQEIMSAVMQQWQRDLNAFGSLELQNASVFNSTVSSGNFDIAIISVGADSGSPAEILDIFSEGYRGYEFYNNETFTSLLERAVQSGEKEDYYAAEQFLIDDFAVYPISFTESRLLLSNKILEVSYTPGFHYIDFASISK